MNVNKARKKAEAAIYKEIADASARANPEQLKDLAEAAAKLKWGAQGRTIYDYHSTNHPPERKPVGFKGDAE